LPSFVHLNRKAIVCPNCSLIIARRCCSFFQLANGVANNLVLPFRRNLLPHDATRKVDRDICACNGKILHRRVTGSPDFADRAGQLVVRGLFTFGLNPLASVLRDSLK
jgi:hypothetical protein